VPGRLASPCHGRAGHWTWRRAHGVPAQPTRCAGAAAGRRTQNAAAALGGAGLVVGVALGGAASGVCSPGLGSRTILAGPEQQGCSPVPGCCRHRMERERGWSCWVLGLSVAAVPWGGQGSGAHPELERGIPPCPGTQPRGVSSSWSRGGCFKTWPVSSQWRGTGLKILKERRSRSVWINAPGVAGCHLARPLCVCAGRGRAGLCGWAGCRNREGSRGPCAARQAAG